MCFGCEHKPFKIFSHHIKTTLIQWIFVSYHHYASLLDSSSCVRRLSAEFAAVIAMGIEDFISTIVDDGSAVGNVGNEYWKVEEGGEEEAAYDDDGKTGTVEIIGDNGVCISRYLRLLFK